MSRIRSERTGPELELLAALRRAGLRPVLHNKRLPGRPDFSFSKIRLAVFLDGCFWHGCPAHYRSPRSNRRFWRLKLDGNRRRDRRARRRLNHFGWRTMTVRECAVKARLKKATARIIRRTRPLQCL